MTGLTHIQHFGAIAFTAADARDHESSPGSELKSRSHFDQVFAPLRVLRQVAAYLSVRSLFVWPIQTYTALSQLP